MTLDEIKEKLIPIFTEYTQVSRDDLLKEDILPEAIDSFTLLEIVFRIEETFDIEVPDERLKRIKSFEDIAQAIAGAMGMSK